MSQRPRPHVYFARYLRVTLMLTVGLSVIGCANSAVNVHLLQLRPGTDTDLQGSTPRSLLQSLFDPCNWQKTDSLRPFLTQPCNSSSYSPTLPRVPVQRIP